MYVSLHLAVTYAECTYTRTRCIPGYVCMACCNAVANMPVLCRCPIRQSALNTSGTMPIVAWVRYNVAKACCSNRERIVSRGRSRDYFCERRENSARVADRFLFSIFGKLNFSRPISAHCTWYRYLKKNISAIFQSILLFFGKNKISNIVLI